MEKEPVEKKSKTVLEEKIDFLIAESEKAKLERKKERVLSKIDGLYNVLIALSTFLVGLIISQHGFFVNAFTFSLLFSFRNYNFYVNFTRMNKNNGAKSFCESRICLLQFFGYFNDFIYCCKINWKYSGHFLLF